MNKLIAETRAVLEGGYPRLRFPPTLEKAFIENYQHYAVSSLRSNIKYILIVYVLLGLGIVLMLPWDSLGGWPITHAIIGTAILAAAIVSRLPRFDPYHQYYTGALAGCGIVVTICAPSFYSDPRMVQVAQMGTLYGVIIIYTSVGLRFRAAVGSCLAAGIVGLLYVWYAHLKINWLLFHEAYTGGNILGMVLAYLGEHRGRTTFLQSRLLELEKQYSEQMAAQMEQMTREDALTGLSNRRYFDVVFHREWKRAERYGTSIAVLFVDVDHFKQYNDYYGHQKGDECLKKVADILNKQCNRAGDMAARFGGEEFVLVYPQTGVEGLVAIAERTLKAVRDARIPHANSATANCVTVSIGIANCIPTSKIDPEILLKQADMAVYGAKQNGRNRWSASTGDPMHIN